MNENAKLWVDELRSGNFEQARRRLRDHIDEDREGYCCLGVACVLYERETGLGHWDGDGTFVVADLDANHAELPNAVREWLGLTNVAGWYGQGASIPADRPHDSKDCLAIKNDAGAPFTEIADIIESEPLGLFVS